MTLMLSPNIVYPIFKFEMYSFVIKIAIDVNKAVEEVNTLPMLGIISDIVELPIDDPDPINVSVIFNNSFFLFNDLYSFLYHSLSILRDFIIFS